ncbi:transposable element Tc3 transposase, partial [Caerostris darwini]
TFINGIYAQVAQTKVRIHTDTSNEIDKTPIVATPSLSSVSETNRVGLVSSRISTSVKDGTTTVYTTNVYGTYIGEVYAHLAQTTSNVIQPTSTTQNPYPTGLISSATRLEDNYGTVTLWTTQVYGTFVNNYYAHIASTHSNVFVNSKSSEVVPQPSTYYNNLFTESLQQVKPPTPTARSIDNSKTYKTGLLSSIVSEEEHEGTTTQYVTNIFGTYIGEQYAKHAKTSSKIIAPTSTESSLRSVGLISTIVNSVVNQNIVTLFKTEIIGTYLGQHYAQLARTSTEYKFLTTETPKPTSTEPVRQKTGLLSSSVIRSEINSGTTTMHINEIYGTYIGNNYAHVAKSTSKVIQPTQIENKGRDTPITENVQKTGLISSSVKTEVNDGTTTLHISEIHGTYVGNYYAHVARRTSTVLPYSTTSTSLREPIPASTAVAKSEGLISSDIRTEVNQGTTTLHTREVHGTFINGFYAHVARSTSNIITPTPTSSTSNTGLISAITSSETNNGIVTLHTTEIFGTRINGFYAHIARSTSNIITSTASPEMTSNTIGIITATTSTEVNNGDTTVHRTSVIGTEIDGVYVQSVKKTSSVIYAPRLYPEAITKTLYETESTALLIGGTAKDDLDTARVNELGNGNQFVSLMDNGDLEIKTPINSRIDLLSPSLNSDITIQESINTITTKTPDSSFDLLDSISTKPLEGSSLETSSLESVKSSTTTTLSTKDATIEPSLQNKNIEKITKPTKPEDNDDYNDYNDNKTFKDKESVTSKPNNQEQNIPRKNKIPPLSSSRHSDSHDEYDDYEFGNDYDEFGENKNKKITPSLSSSRFKNTRQPKRKTDSFNDRDYDNYDDYDYPDDESSLIKATKTTSEVSTTKETPSSSIRIRPFTGRGRPTFTTTSRSSTKASFTIQFRRPSRTRNSRAFGHRSDSENDFDDEINSEDEEGDIEASEAVVTTATPQVLSFSRRKPFGGSRFQPPGRNAPSSTTSRPIALGRNRRPFGRSSSTSPSPTPSIKDNDPDYEENTTEDDEFDDYDEINDKKEANRNRNFRSTRRPPSRVSRFGERRSSSNKRGSFRHREEEETENDDFDSTTPNYRNTRNRLNQRKPSRGGRYNRNNSQSLKASFNSVSRDEDDDSQSLQPINRLRNNNRNRRPSYNPRTKRPSKTASETQTPKKPYLTVTSVVTTVKTLPIYHGFRTSYATLTTTALDTSIIHPTQYSEVISNDVTKTVFYTKTGYPDGIENLHTTVTEVVVTTTSLASVKLVPIKIGFSTRTDTVTDIQVLTTLSTLLSVITPDTPQPTAFPQQFQPNFYPQLGPQNPPDFGLVASANSFVTTQIVTSTTVVPIILRGRTILSTLTTTSTAESTVVQTVHLPQSQPNFIPQPYFAFQPLTTLLTLYVTGEHGELKPVVTTVTVPLYQQPVFHTKVARSLQQNVPSEHSLKTADIMDLQLMSSLGRDYSRDVDIDTHYDQLLSSGLEEINDLSEIQNTNFQTEPLDSTRIPNAAHGIVTYDVTTISKGPLTEIYEQRVTVNLDTDESKLKQNEIERSKDAYGLESRYSFRKLQQVIEEEPIFRPQRDFTRLRRPPAAIVLATAAERRPEVQPTDRIPIRPRQSPPNRRPAIENFNEDTSDNPRNGFRGSFSRPARRPVGSFRRPFVPPNSDNELRDNPISLQPSQPSSAPDDVEKIQDLLSSFQDTNSNLNNRFVGSPSETDTSNGFKPLSNPAGFRRGPGAAVDDSNNSPVLRPRRLRITRPLNAEETLNPSGVRRITRIRSPIIEPSTVNIEKELTPTNDFSVNSVSPVNDEEDSLEVNTLSPSDESLSPSLEGISNENIAGRRTVVRRVRPSFVPGDGSGPRRPLVVRRTRINDNPTSTVSSDSIDEAPPSSSFSPEIKENTESLSDQIISNAESSVSVSNDHIDPSKPLKKVIRLRKPENGETPQTGARRRIVISRRPPGTDSTSSNTVQGRGPVSDNNLISDNGNVLHNENDLDGFNKPVSKEQVVNPHELLSVYATKNYPITYYTTLTYFTTFLHGPDVNYASREATFSNVIDQTLNPNLIRIFKYNSGRVSPTNVDSILHLASRTLGDTTTIVNLASIQNIYNSDVYQDLKNIPIISEITRPVQPAIAPTSTINRNILSRTPINSIAPLPKTYLTLFTYSYTFFDGLNKRESTRAETMTNVATDPVAFLTENIGTFINAEGHLILGPETRTVHLGSREVEGTTTEVNLGLKTLIKVDGIKNVIIEKTQPIQYITPSRTSLPDLTSSTVASYETPKAVILDSSYSSANDLYDTSQQSASAETLPLYSSGLDEASNIVVGPRPVVKVTSVIHKQTGPLRSGVFEPRPGVRVRVRPVVSRRLVPSDLASSFDISFDTNDLSTEYPIESLASPQYIPPGIMSTPTLDDAYITTMILPSEDVGNDNEIASDGLEIAAIDASTSDGAAAPTRKKLKVTVRRPQSESISRTHTRFVLPSRFEITSKPRFYVVTRTGALGVVSNSQRPFTVKISRKLKPTSTAEVVPLGPPSTTVIYDTFTTLTSVPVIFGLDTSFRNVILTTSSPITVSFVPTPTFESETAIAPSTVVLTFFTTTTFTIPYIEGDETILTTLEETNSRIVTQTLGLDSLSYSTITRTPSYDDIVPTILPVTSVEFGFDGPITHTLSSESKEPDTIIYETISPKTVQYETKTFYTTYTFFSTFFAGPDPVVSSSEQVVTNVVTVPITTEAIQPSSVEVTDIGPLTVFDTSESVITKTNYNTVTFYATLFSDTSSFVTPIEEVETQFQTITETYIITKTIMPTPSATFEPSTVTPTISETTESEKSVVVTQTLYTTFTNFVTLFQGTDTVVTNLEETVSNVVTLTVPESAASSFTITPTSETFKETSETFISSSFPSYTTREVVNTLTHYLTLFNNGEGLLSSITEVVTSYVTELAGPSSSPTYPPETFFSSSPEVFLVSSQLPSYTYDSYSPTETTESTSEIQTYHPELVPSIRKIYSTLTFYTTYYSDTSSIVASQTEVITSYVTLFVPPSLISSSTTTTSTTTTKIATMISQPIEPTSTIDPSVFVFTTTDYSTLTLYTTLFSGDEIVVISSEHVVPEVITATITPSSTSPSETSTTNESVLTFLTTFTYYTTRFSGTDPIIASSESVVTQYVTIEAPPSVSSTSEVVIESTPVDETILGVSTASGGDISSSFSDDMKGIEIIGVSSVVGTGIEASPTIETKIQIESKVHSEINSTPLFSLSEISSEEKDTISSIYISSSFTPSEESVKTSTSTPVLVSSTSEMTSESEDVSLPVTSTSIVTKETELIGVDGQKTSLLPSDTLILVTGTDGFVTKLAEIDTDVLSPVYIPPSKESSPSPSSEIKPATVIELSDLLGGNTALGGDIDLAIQDIVSRITGKKNKTETDEILSELTTTELTTEDQKLTTGTTPITTKLSEDTTGTDSIESTTESSTETDLKKDDRLDSKELDYPIFILPDHSIRDKESSTSEDLAPVYIPSTAEKTTSIPTYLSYNASTEKTSEESTKSNTKISSHSVSTSVITGARTVFIVPTKSSKEQDSTRESYSVVHDSSTKERAPRIEISDDTAIVSSMKSAEKSSTAETPGLNPSIGTSVISGIRTIFFEPDLDKTTDSFKNSQTSRKEESILGRANVEVEKPKTFTTITKDGKTVVSRTTSGATTIFFPGQIPKHTAPVISTRYITSVESITRTLALTTARTYYTRDSTLTVPSVYTTTIPPRTFVSTIIGSRTILGILPEPTETVQVHKTQKPSERTTTVTTTTLIFNSIPSTVVRTLVLPTGVPTKTITSKSSSSVYNPPEANVFNAGTERPAKPPEVGDSTSINDENMVNSSEKSDLERPVQKARDETYLRAAGPRLFESRPDVIHEQNVHRPAIVITESSNPEDDPFLNGRNGVCDPKCQPYKKEMCKENKGLWTCQCRPGHARRDSHEICKEIQTFVMLLKVVKMGNESVNFSKPLTDSDSDEYKNFVKNVKDGIADAYSITHVKDHIWNAEVNNIMSAEATQDSGTTMQTTTQVPEEAGVLVNLTLKVSKSVSGNLLEQELTRSLQSLGMRVGDSSLLAAPLSQNIQDFDECLDISEHDCALRASCINLEGSFTCQCEEGFEDMDRSLPGRICLAKTENCNYCHARGDCLRGDDDKTFCRCQPMFVGRRCEINGLVLAVALPSAVAVVVLLLCAVLCCCRKCKKKSPSHNSGDPGSVFRGIALKGPLDGTLDRKAMIDTSSESSGEHGRKGMPFEGYQESGDVTPHKGSRRSDLSLNRSLSTGYTSPPVMIPRAKQPPAANKPMNYAVYDGQVNYLARGSPRFVVKVIGAQSLIEPFVGSFHWTDCRIAWTSRAMLFST